MGQSKSFPSGKDYNLLKFHAKKFKIIVTIFFYLKYYNYLCPILKKAGHNPRRITFIYIF